VGALAIYIGGGFTALGGQLRNNLAPFDMVTNLAAPWNPNANAFVTHLTISNHIV